MREEALGHSGCSVYASRKDGPTEWSGVTEVSVPRTGLLLPKFAPPARPGFAAPARPGLRLGRVESPVRATVVSAPPDREPGRSRRDRGGGWGEENR